MKLISSVMKSNEVKWAIRNTRRRKALGPDMFHTEPYKCNGKLFIQIPIILFNKALEKGGLSASMQEGIIKLLFKETMTRETCVNTSNYRPITLLNTDD